MFSDQFECTLNLSCDNLLLSLGVCISTITKQPDSQVSLDFFKNAPRLRNWTPIARR